MSSLYLVKTLFRLNRSQIFGRNPFFLEGLLFVVIIRPVNISIFFPFDLNRPFRLVPFFQFDFGHNLEISAVLGLDSYSFYFRLLSRFPAQFVPNASPNPNLIKPRFAQFF